jgi:hypothetical protein
MSLYAPLPDDQLRAGHIPSALIPDGVDPRTVVLVVQVVQPPRRTFVRPFLAVCACTVGFLGVVATALALLDLASQVAESVAAAPIGLGVSYSINRLFK